MNSLREFKHLLNLDILHAQCEATRLMVNIGWSYFFLFCSYTLPRFTFRDHLRDCFGWLWLRPKRESTPSPFTQAMISLFADRVAPTDFLTPIFHSFLDSDEEVEIDIVRGEQP